jgi:hypothetical protein
MGGGPLGRERQLRSSACAVTIPIGGFSALSPRGQPSLFDPKPKFEATLSTVESGRSIMREAAH